MKITLSMSLVLMINLICSTSVQATITLPAIVSSNMVLQRNTTVEIWGWADPNEKISMKASWLSEALNLEADTTGSWHVQVKTTNSKAPQTIQLTSNTSKINLDNILFGEVWLCAGQSNMKQPLKGYKGEPTFGALMATAKSKNPHLRLFTVGKTAAKKPRQNVEEYTAWQSASPDVVFDFSAVAYFYGQQLQEILDVPVGLILSAWEGSKIEAWMSQEAISRFQEVNLDEVDITNRPKYIPTALYNTMIHPLIPYTMKGALWYQGESNRTEPEPYKALFPAMVKDWRTRWGLGDFPFYYVQIAPYWYKNSDAYQTTENSAFLRETQLQCLELIPNSGMAITLDIGTEYCIHPPNKKQVADRLLFHALHQTYGFNTIDYAGPTYETKERKDGGMMLKFKHAETGLYAYQKLEGFEIAANDRVFYPANATIIDDDKVFVQCDRVKKPVAVRYAWSNWVVGTLYDTNLLPASSFRTDNWKDATQVKD